MSPAVNPNIPAAPPPPPVPTSPGPDIILAPAAPSSPAKSVDLNLLRPSSGPDKSGETLRRQTSFNSLLHKFASDQHFATEWLDLDDDNCSVVSVDSCQSAPAGGLAGSTYSGNLSRKGSIVDLEDIKAVAAKSQNTAEGLSKDSVAQLDKRMDGMKIDPHRKKLSQAMIWTWLTSTKHSVPEDDVPQPKIIGTESADKKQVELSQIDTEKLRAKLMKTYPRSRYYRDLNATSPNNW